MTAMIGLPIALLVGLLFGRGRTQLVVVALVWYAALAWQTAYIAAVGRTAFGGNGGLETVHWWVYWAFQPVLLAGAFGLVWIGSRAHDTIRRTLSRSRTPSSSPSIAAPGSR
jgi:hypothetical protein